MDFLRADHRQWGAATTPLARAERDARGYHTGEACEEAKEETGRPIYAESELDKESLVNRLKVSFKRLTKMLLTEPAVTSFTLWIAFAWAETSTRRRAASTDRWTGILFLFFPSVPQTFEADYGFDTFQSGLVQLAIDVGALIGMLINPIADVLYLKSAKRNPEVLGRPIPEARLYTAIPARCCLHMAFSGTGGHPAHRNTG